MKKKYIVFVIGMVLVFSNVGAANEECDAFRNHLRDVYYKKFDQPENRAEELRFQDDLIKQAKVFGYALSNQLQYIKRGSLHEVFYKKCVKRAKEEIKKLAIEIKESKNWSDEFTKKMETRALREFEAATFGFYDTEMAKLTGVKMKDAPDYFLARGRTDIQAQNQTGTGQPGVNAGAPPQSDIVTPGVASDAILGKWQAEWFGAYGNMPGNDIAVVVRRAAGDNPGRYEGYILSVGKSYEKQGFRPRQLYWKLTFEKKDWRGKLCFDCLEYQIPSRGQENTRGSYRKVRDFCVDIQTQEISWTHMRWTR